MFKSLQRNICVIRDCNCYHPVHRVQISSPINSYCIVLEQYLRQKSSILDLYIYYNQP